jgi:cell division protein FtsB
MKAPKLPITGSSIVNVVGAILIVYLMVVLGQTVKRNYDLGRQIDDLKQQMTSLEDQKNELAYSLQYYKTDSFRDREARSKLGLQAPGENVVIIPQKSPSPAPTAGSSKPATRKSNLQQWFDFLGGA